MKSKLFEYKNLLNEKYSHRYLCTGLIDSNPIFKTFNTAKRLLHLTLLLFFSITKTVLIPSLGKFTSCNCVSPAILRYSITKSP